MICSRLGLNAKEPYRHPATRRHARHSKGHQAVIEPPYYPIVYLRGYAGSQGEIEDTVSTPYTGFNLGSTRIRQIHTGDVNAHVFESPVIRLMKDHGYVDAYHDGHLLPQGTTPSRSIWIYRYYDVADEDFGDGDRREIEFHATRLGEFLAHVRKAVLEKGEEPRRFRAYLVAHSMGGLICRSYLQNRMVPDLDNRKGKNKTKKSSKGVDKVFTYGTPHGGIDFRRGLGWLEGLRDFLDPNNAGNFGPKRMRTFLGLRNRMPINSLNGWFPEERFFCLVGTDAGDYRAAAGLSKRAVGPSSDGLVQIRNASVLRAPRAFVHRSHSGHYGLVNSESGYENLRRFFFGELRVTVEMCGVTVTLPPELEKARQEDRLRASYHIDAVVSVRGVPVELHRRTYDERSAIFRTYDQLTKQPTTLFTAFLLPGARVRAKRRSLGLAVRLLIRVPDYEVDEEFWLDSHYEGGTLFADKLNLEVTPRADGLAGVKYGWDTRTPNGTSCKLAIATDGDAQVGTISFGCSNVRPGICGDLRITVTPWNTSPRP